MMLIRRIFNVGIERVLTILFNRITVYTIYIESNSFHLSVRVHDLSQFKATTHFIVSLSLQLCVYYTSHTYNIFTNSRHLVPYNAMVCNIFAYESCLVAALQVFIHSPGAAR